MTRDARESLTALVAVSSFVGLFCLTLWLIPNDLKIPRWVMLAFLGLNIASLIGAVLRRRYRAEEKPE